MADYLIHDSTLEDIADAIRSKTGGSSLIAPEDMADEIESISSGGSDIVKYEYVQVSDWSSSGDTKGFFQTYCNHGYGLYYAEITNNDAGDYKAIKGIFNRGMISNLYGVCQRQTNITSGVDSGYSFRIVPGANIVVWYVPLEVLV